MFYFILNRIIAKICSKFEFIISIKWILNKEINSLTVIAKIFYWPVAKENRFIEFSLISLLFWSQICWFLTLSTEVLVNRKKWSKMINLMNQMLTYFLHKVDQLLSRNAKIIGLNWREEGKNWQSEKSGQMQIATYFWIIGEITKKHKRKSICFIYVRSKTSTWCESKWYRRQLK